MTSRTMRISTAALGVVVAGSLVGTSRPAAAQAVHWADWTSQSPIVGNQATVNGTIMVGSTPVSLSYTGEVTFAQTTGAGTNFWNPRSTFLGAVLTDASPISSDIIALNGRGISSTITFGSPILNPFVSFISLGRGGVPVDYVFDAQPVILTGGPSANFGGGPIVPLPGDPNGIRGIEGNGTVRFLGTYTSLTFTATGDEFWGGITVGVQGLGSPTTVPEPATVALMATGLAGLLGVAGVRRRRRS